MLPSILARKCYSIDPPKHIPADKHQQQAQNTIVDKQAEKENSRATTIDENFIQLVYKRLVSLARTEKFDESGHQNRAACSSYYLYNSIKNSSKIEGPGDLLSPSRVLAALKELEMRGFVYSCQDEFHYLPIN